MIQRGRSEPSSETAAGAAARAEVERRHIMAFMSGFSIETTPRSAATIPDFRQHLRPGCTVYITFIVGSDFRDTIALAARLRTEGFNPVPHLAARSIPDRHVLRHLLERLSAEAAVSQVLLIGGAISNPLGGFSDSMQLLDTGLFDKYGIAKIGISGHPEGHPTIPEEALRRALKWKNDFARRTGAQMYIVTQFCFEAEPVIEWDKEIRAEGNALPVHIGIPGLATIKTLIGYASACGVGESARFITRQAKNVAKLLSVSAPEALVTALASYQAKDPACGIRGLHVYPFGGLKKSAEWCYALADGRFTIEWDHGRSMVQLRA